MLSGCISAPAPPSRPDDVCAIFAEQPHWRRAATRSAERWGTPVPTALAFIRHESSFRADARPPRQRILGILPWRRPSSAYGYAQATDAAWADYRRDTGRRWFVSRTEFADAVDFVGWYNARTMRELRLPASDTMALYLAYHEGTEGYRNGSWRRKPALQRYAEQVAARARSYAAALEQCP